MIVCYEYKTGSGKYFFSTAKVYNMIPVAGWRVKKEKITIQKETI